MNEEMRHEIVRRRQGGASMRRIARDLGLARETVQGVLRRWQAERAGQESAGGVPARRPSRVDPFHDTIRQLLTRYPDITIVRVFEELRAQGFTGGLTIVRERVLELRAQPPREPVRRFETAPGVQAQMDYSSYDIDFTEEGRRRVHLFSYVLGYSRRQYLRFVESQDLPTTLREHVRAFEHLGGIAATCLYDNMKVVVLRHGDEGPLYNPKFLAFATHYGFTPRACRVRRSQTKGKVERPFWYAESNLLNGRTFRTLAHLNEVTAWWLAHVADVRLHRETKQRPLDRHAEERPHLLPLPATPYDVAVVAYRVVNVEGFVVYQQNSYSVPWRYIGQALPVRVTETEVIVYGAHLEEIARHRLWPRGQTGQRAEDKAHRPGADPRRHEALLRERFVELGPLAERFLDGLLRGQRYGQQQALKLLALQSSYARVDLLAALERAVRFGAYTLSAVERILAAQAQPRSCLDVLAEQERRHLPAHLRDNPVSPRQTTDYQHLVEEATDHGPSPESQPEADDPPRPDADPGRPA
jgi:transposase